MGQKNTINIIIRLLREQQDRYGDLASIEDMIDLIVTKFGKK
jgi:hypothetical protein